MVKLRRQQVDDAYILSLANRIKTLELTVANMQKMVAWTMEFVAAKEEWLARREASVATDTPTEQG